MASARDAAPGHDRGIGRGFHGEAGAQESESGESERSRPVGGRLDDADQRDGRAGLDLVEDKMRRIGGHEAEAGPGVSQPLDLGAPIIPIMDMRS
jgi:hypothetical protein